MTIAHFVHGCFDLDTLLSLTHNCVIDLMSYELIVFTTCIHECITINHYDTSITRMARIT